MGPNPKDPINFDQSLVSVLKVNSQKTGGTKIRNLTKGATPVIQVDQEQKLKNKKFLRKKPMPIP